MINREWHLLSRPVGWPKPEDFALVETPVPTPGEGQVLVRNKYLSVDPYMRGRMSEAKSYVAPFELGKVMQGGAVGEVIESRAEGISAGDHVLHFFGWREYAAVDARHAVKVDPEAAPLSTYLGVLAHDRPDRLRRPAAHRLLQEGDTVFVSGAAGGRGQPGGPDRQAQGRLPGHRLGRVRREGQAAGGRVRLRRRVQFSRTARSPSSCARRRPTASTSTSTTSAGTTSRPRSAR